MSLYPSGYQQDDHDDQDQAGAAARVVTPAAAVGPCRQGTNQDQYEDDQQNSAQHVTLLVSRGSSLRTTSSRASPASPSRGPAGDSGSRGSRRAPTRRRSAAESCRAPS